MKPAIEISDAELRAEYEKTALHTVGVTFDRAIEIPAIRTALAGPIKHRRIMAAKQGADSAIQHQTREAA
jgi:hypothetical protein